MALFKSQEEKAQEQANKERETLAKYGMDNLADPYDQQAVAGIIRDLVGTNVMEAGMKISLTKAEIALPVYYQRAILEQNFIIIRQLDRIAELLQNK